MNNHVERGFGLKRNLDYFKENFKIMWKLNIEYKVNFFFSIFQLFIYTIIQIFIVIFFSEIFIDSVYWDRADFFIFYVFLFFSNLIGGFFGWAKDLFRTLTSGELNLFLTKPIPIYIGYIFNNLMGWALVSLFFRIIVFIIIINYFNLKLYNLGLVIFTLLLLNVYFFLIMQFFDSLEFLYKKLSRIQENYWKIFDPVIHYPTPIFENIKIKYLFYGYNAYFIGILLIPLIRGYEIVTNLYVHYLVLFSIILVLILIIRFNWHYGLKKYEAFG